MKTHIIFLVWGIIIMVILICAGLIKGLPLETIAETIGVISGIGLAFFFWKNKKDKEKTK